MTINALTYVYGVAVKRIDFFKWVMAHPESTWYKKIEKLCSGPYYLAFSNFIGYAKWLESHDPLCGEQIPDEFSETEAEFFSEIAMDKYAPLPTKAAQDAWETNTCGVFTITQDHEDDDMVILGERRAFTIVHLKDPVDIYTKLPYAKLSYTHRLIEAMKDVDIFNIEKASFFTLQDSCWWN